MSKEDIFTVDGVVTELLPNALFKVKLDQGSDILCHLKGKMRIHNINIRLMDRVTVEMSVYDTSKGRISFRHKPDSFKHH
jgi:translation initiation factor IF-1